jgi:hypothetical protein
MVCVPSGPNFYGFGCVCQSGLPGGAFKWWGRAVVDRSDGTLGDYEAAA